MNHRLSYLQAYRLNRITREQLIAKLCELAPAIATEIKHHLANPQGHWEGGDIAGALDTVVYRMAARTEYAVLEELGMVTRKPEPEPETVLWHRLWPYAAWFAVCVIVLMVWGTR